MYKKTCPNKYTSTILQIASFNELCKIPEYVGKKWLAFPCWFRVAFPCWFSYPFHEYYMRSDLEAIFFARFDAQKHNQLGFFNLIRNIICYSKNCEWNSAQQKNKPKNIVVYVISLAYFLKYMCNKWSLFNNEGWFQQFVK